MENFKIRSEMKILKYKKHEKITVCKYNFFNIYGKIKESKRIGE